MKRETDLKKIKVLLVDDHPLVLEGIRSSLLKQDRFQIVGQAATGQEALERARKASPDVVVMDISMPGMDGLEATRRLQTVCPQTKVLILTVHEKAEFIREMIQSGARGYLRKNTSPAQLVSAIECVHAGELFFEADVAQAFFEEYVLNEGKIKDSSPKRLSKREHEVLRLIVEGLANKEIAAKFRLSVRTVEKHRQSLMKKLGIHKATELVKFAITRGFVSIFLAITPLLLTSCQQAGTGALAEHQAVTFKTAQAAPDGFDAWDFVWKGPKRAATVNLQEVVLQPNGQEYAKQDFAAYPGKSDTVQSSFSPGFAGGDPKVFYNQPIRIAFRVEKGGVAFGTNDIKSFKFRFFKKDSNGDVDWRTPFQKIDALVEQ